MAWQRGEGRWCAAVEIVRQALQQKLSHSEVSALLHGFAAFRAGPRACRTDIDDESLSVLANILPESTAGAASAGAAPAAGADSGAGDRKRRRHTASAARAAVAAVAATEEDAGTESEAEEAASDGDTTSKGTSGPRCVLRAMQQPPNCAEECSMCRCVPAVSTVSQRFKLGCNQVVPTRPRRPRWG